MPLWLVIALGAGLVYLFTRPSTTVGTLSSGTGTSSFYVGQNINIAATEVYSDTALTQDAGSYPGGTGTVRAIDTTNNSIGFVGPTGAGIGGGALGYVASSAVTAA